LEVRLLVFRQIPGTGVSLGIGNCALAWPRGQTKSANTRPSATRIPDPRDRT